MKLTIDLDQIELDDDGVPLADLLKRTIKGEVVDAISAMVKAEIAVHEHRLKDAARGAVQRMFNALADADAEAIAAELAQGMVREMK